MKFSKIFFFLIIIYSQFFGQTQNILPIDSSQIYKISDEMLVGDQLDEFTVVENNPIYAPGSDSIKAYFSMVELPKEVKNYFARIFIMFVVDPEGNVDQAQFLKCILPDHLLMELIKATNDMKNWIPATHDGKRVFCLYKLGFTISGGKARVRYK